jgi:hypothetical protein
MRSSLPHFPFQQFAFDQPNIAVLYFPFIWLPSCVVPLVLLSHLAAIRQLSNYGKKTKLIQDQTKNMYFRIQEQS